MSPPEFDEQRGPANSGKWQAILRALEIVQIGNKVNCVARCVKQAPSGISKIKLGCNGNGGLDQLTLPTRSARPMAENSSCLILYL